MKLTKYLYHVLMINDIFPKMELIHQYMDKMINFDDYVNKNKTEHNEKWPYSPDYPYRILIIGDSG